MVRESDNYVISIDRYEFNFGHHISENVVWEPRFSRRQEIGIRNSKFRLDQFIWPAPGLDDTWLSKSGLPLELHRAQITDRRVSAFRVVEALDIVKHVCLCFIARPVRFVAGALGLQRGEEALHRGVVPHVA